MHRIFWTPESNIMSTCSGSITVSRSITTSLRSMEKPLHRYLHPQNPQSMFSNTSRQLTSQHIFWGSSYWPSRLPPTENLKNVLIILKTDGSQQSGNRQFLLTVNVSVHDVVDVSGKLNPRTLERDDTGRIKFGTIGMYALTEEYARRTVKLGYNNTFRTVDDEK